MRENGDVEAPSHPSARPTAIVIGAGFGGISVAGRLARAGYSVTCLEKAATPGGRCAELVRDGHRFDSLPRNPKSQAPPSWPVRLRGPVFEHYYSGILSPPVDSCLPFLLGTCDDCPHVQVRHGSEHSFSTISIPRGFRGVRGFSLISCRATACGPNIHCQIPRWGCAGTDVRSATNGGAA